MGRRWQKVGIIAGGGDLPFQLAKTCTESGAPFHVVALRGYADETLAKNYPATECGLAELGKIIRLLKEQHCDAVVLAGLVQRPNFGVLKPDWRGAALLPRVIRAARQGDGAILSVLVDTFAAEGFIVLGAEEVAGGLHPSPGQVGAAAPSDRDLADIVKAAGLVDALGPFDVGQAAVVRDGFVIAIEAAEGTDVMLRRCAPIVSRLQGEEGRTERAGILLKRPKPEQELRVDLPTIGPQTIELVGAAGLAGVAVEAGASLILDRDRVAEIADGLGVFVFAYDREQLSRRS